MVWDPAITAICQVCGRTHGPFGYVVVLGRAWQLDKERLCARQTRLRTSSLRTHGAFKSSNGRSTSSIVRRKPVPGPHRCTTVA